MRLSLSLRRLLLAPSRNSIALLMLEAEAVEAVAMTLKVTRVSMLACLLTEAEAEQSKKQQRTKLKVSMVVLRVAVEAALHL